LKQRIISGLLAGGFFYILCLLGGYWFSAMIIVLAILGYAEYMRMMQLKKDRLLYILGLLGVLVVVLPWDYFGFLTTLSISKTVWLSMLFMLILTVITKNRVTIDQTASVLFGVLYLGFGFHYMILTRFIDPHGVFWVSIVLLCIIATDSGAYFAGMLFGKHLLWPAISPKKTIEGAIGGLVLSVFVAFIFHLAEPKWLSVVETLYLAIAIAVLGQMGDLIQSAYKRVKGVKDTGSILPGHGGILDRVDSWLIVFPFVYMFTFLPH